MDTQVKEGVYLGIYITEEKVKTLQELETYIRANTNVDKYVPFLDRVPMAYVMTKAKPCIQYIVKSMVI